LGTVALSPTQSGTTGHGPRLDGIDDGSPLGGPTEIGPPLWGPAEENHPLLGAVALQLGTTGPSPMRLVTTGSCHHTGPTCTMTTRHGSRHSGPEDDGPRLRGPKEESHLPVGAAALSPTCSNMTGSPTPRCGPRPIQPRTMTTRHDPRLNGTNKVQQLGPTEESRPLLGAVALSPTHRAQLGHLLHSRS
jgi:hypothetical protein